MLNKIIQTKRHFIVLISVLLVTLFLCLSLISIGGVAYAESSSLRETRILAQCTELQPDFDCVYGGVI